MFQRSMMFLVLLTVSFGSHAAIVSADHGVFGVGSLTEDTDQGLAFLEVPLTENNSFNDIILEFGAGGSFEGFRHATRLEVVTLVNNFGFSPGAVEGSDIPGNTGADQLSGLVDLLGVSFTSGTNFRATSGSTSTPFATGVQAGVRLTDFLGSTRHDVVNASSSVAISQTASNATNGHWLVQEASVVPIPAALPLFLTAIAGLGFLAKRRKTA